MSTQSAENRPAGRRITARQVLIAILGVLFVAAVLWVGLNFENLRALQQMPSGAQAKFLCSTLFVVGMDEASARAWSAVPLPVQQVEIDYEAKQVTVRALFVTSRAVYEGERFGCTLR